MRQTLSALLLTATALIALPAYGDDEKPVAPAAAVDTAPAAAKPAEASKDYTIVKMGNDNIKSSEVVDVWKGLFPGGAAPDFNSFDENIRQNVVRGVISERLIYEEAQKSGIDKSDEVKKRIAAVQKQIIMQTFMEKKAKELVTDAQLKTAYDAKVAAAKGQEEVRARHILVPTEDEAKKVAEQLKKGGDFEKIAKEKSADKGSGANGGELGWFTRDKMVPEFAEAAFKLKKGETSAPVKTAFGWHIIQLEDRRPVQVASFDDMKESLKSEVANKSVQAYVESLLKNADIKYYAPDGKEKPFSTSLTPAKPPTAPAE